ncbi:MAG: spore coat associated protein CotJA [Clostridia bacterium]|nr:spore coat associated protein CotJA [Clostridia bacterium]
MERNPRGVSSADFDQFSKFLRGNGISSRYAPCNSENGGASQENNTRPTPSTGRSLAMVYAVKQPWENIYDPEIALINGTIFEALNKPFEKSGCSINNGCTGGMNCGGIRR